MLHLFNKVYLEFDDKIEINLDRIVISEQYGKKMHIELDKVAYGELITYGETYEEVVTDFFELIDLLKTHNETTGKKLIIYCDKTAYKKFIAQWFRAIMPNLNADSFKTLVDHTIFNQRATSNTQLSSVYSVDLTGLWSNFGDIKTYWDDAKNLSNEKQDKFNALELKLSYEFLIANYLAGSTTHKEELKTTMHMFMRRWFNEVFTDNRQMVLLNANNHAFQKAFNFYPAYVNLTSKNPLEEIEQLSSYADLEIWQTNDNYINGIFGTCNIAGLSTEKLTNLKNTIRSVYEKYEGMQINNSIFDVLDWVDIAARDSITDEELEEIINYIVEAPFDTNLVPRFDFQNVNFPLLLWFLRQKYENNDLSKFRLL